MLQKEDTISIQLEEKTDTGTYMNIQSLDLAYQFLSNKNILCGFDIYLSSQKKFYAVKFLSEYLTKLVSLIIGGLGPSPLMASCRIKSMIPTFHCVGIK